MAESGAERSRKARVRKGAIPRGPLRPHGTVGAARRHQRRGEPLCEPCGKAMRSYWVFKQREHRSKKRRNDE